MPSVANKGGSSIVVHKIAVHSVIAGSVFTPVYGKATPNALAAIERLSKDDR
jgi:hypothetical protein